MNDLFTINSFGPLSKFYPKDNILVPLSHINSSKLTFLNMCIHVCLRACVSVREDARVCVSVRECACLNVCACVNSIYIRSKSEFQFIVMVTWKFLTVNKYDEVAKM